MSTLSGEAGNKYKTTSLSLCQVVCNVTQLPLKILTKETFLVERDIEVLLTDSWTFTTLVFFFLVVMD